MVFVFQYGFDFLSVLLYHVLVMQIKWIFMVLMMVLFVITLNLTSTAWVLYSPAHDLVSSGAICIGPATNNIVEYQAVTGLLTEAASQDIDHLVVFMDSRLVVFHLNHIYAIRKPILLRLF